MAEFRAMTASAAIVVVLVVLAATAVQAVTGFGFALFAVPLLSFAVDPKMAVVLASTVGFVGSALLARTEWSACDKQTAARMTFGAALGSPVGLVVLEIASEESLRIALAVMITVFLVVNVRGLHLQSSSAPLDITFGALSGVLSTSLSTNGPPLVAVLHARHLEPPTFRATLAVVFAASGTLAIGLFAAAGRYDRTTVGAIALCLPALLAGLLIGRHVRGRIAVASFRRVVMALLALTAVASALAAILA